MWPRYLNCRLSFSKVDSDFVSIGCDVDDIVFNLVFIIWALAEFDLESIQEVLEAAKYFVATYQQPGCAVNFQVGLQQRHKAILTLLAVYIC